MDTQQFYPTPQWLARKMWDRFENRNFVRVLEPSAGNGALIDARPRGLARRWRVDAIEPDARHHAVLKEKGAAVVGLDFMEFSGGALYSHIILNPPFSQGARHVLKAWDCLFSGEIVALVNAETVRNPHSRERQHLLKLISDHGSVEFIADAFKGEGVEREANVDVALIHLVKKADVADLVGDLMSELRRDREDHRDPGNIELPRELAIPQSAIENEVRAFRAAVQASRDAILATHRAAYYSRLLGETMAQLRSDGTTRRTPKRDGEIIAEIRADFASRYDELKDRAWTQVLTSTAVRNRLSANARKHLEAEFETIKQLEFTASNVYGFLAGLAASGSELQLMMACEVFDLISRYHTGNGVYYMGWKSNDRHRVCGMRLRTSRFIIPGHQTHSYESGPRWETREMLDDIDRVFALLDGKTEPDRSMVEVMQEQFEQARKGERLSADYFDLRYYPGIGTLHFFPRRADLVDRLNRIVGRHRQWLPPEDVRVNEAFWLQYDAADKLDARMRKELRKQDPASRWSEDRLRYLLYSSMPDEAAQANEAVHAALRAACESAGIDVDAALEAPEGQLALSYDAAV